MAETKWVIRPPVSRQISGPVPSFGELVQHLALALRGHLLGQVARALHPRLLGDEDDLGAEGFHHPTPLQAHVLGHDEHHAIAADGGGHGQGDAGVAGSGLDEGVAGADLPPLLGVADHAHGRAVLHRSGGIVAFQLHQHGAAVGGGKALQADQRCTADEGLDGGKFHESPSRKGSKLPGRRAHR